MPGFPGNDAIARIECVEGSGGVVACAMAMGTFAEFDAEDGTCRSRAWHSGRVESSLLDL
jgi:hypothetical protein